MVPIISSAHASNREEIVTDIVLISAAGSTTPYTSVAFLDDTNILWLDAAEALGEAGFLFKQSQSSITLSDREGNAQELPTEWLETEELAIASIESLESILGWQVTFDDKALSVEIKVPATLPSQLKTLRERADKKTESDLQNLAVKGISLPSIAIDLRSSTNSTSASINAQQAIGNFFLEHQFSLSESGYQAEQFQLRTTVDSELFSVGAGGVRLTLGDLDGSYGQLGAVNGAGISISNYTPSGVNADSRFSFDIEADAEVEVYLDEKLIDFISAGPAREVSVQLPVNRDDQTTLKTITYLNGETRQKSFQLSGNSLTGRKFGYSALAFYQNQGVTDTLDGEIHRRIALSFEPSDKVRLNYSYADIADSARSMQLLNLNYSAASWRASVQYGLDHQQYDQYRLSAHKQFKNWSIDISHQRRDERFDDVTIASGEASNQIRTINSLTLSGAKYSKGKWSLAPRVSFSQSQTLDMDTNLDSDVQSAHWELAGATPLFSYRAQLDSSDGAKTKQSLALYKSYEHLRFSYIHEQQFGSQTNLTTQTLNASLPVNQNKNWGHINARYTVASDAADTYAVSWKRTFRHFDATVSLSGTEGVDPKIQLQLKSRLTLDAKNKTLYATPTSELSESSGDVLFEYELVENGSTTIDAEEIAAMTPELGQIFNVGESQFLATNVSASSIRKLSITGQSNPYLKPELDNKAGVQAAPLGLSHVKLKVHLTGELEGVVNAGDTISGLGLMLKNQDGEIIASAKTEHDGYYYFESLPAGDYQLDINRNDLDILGLSYSPRAVKVEPEDITTLDINLDNANLGAQ